jgi:arsenate reductase
MNSIRAQSPGRPFGILVLCTGNSARSIIGEYLLRARGGSRFAVESAGARPTGKVHPLALRVLAERYGLDASAAHSKSWDAFRGVAFDLVITVCGHAQDACPAWLGGAARAHWGLPDPAAAVGSDTERYEAFVSIAGELFRRADRLTALLADGSHAPDRIPDLAALAAQS